MSTEEAASPGDRCVHPRPFPAEFTGCGAFQPVTFMAADSRNQPLGSWLTCRHLGVGKHDGSSGGFYPRCSLGAPDERLRWLSVVGPAWADVARALQEEFDAFIEGFRAELFRLKAALLERRAGRDIEARRELERKLALFLEATRQFLDARADRLTEIGLPPAPLMELVEEWARAWARSPELTPGVSAARLGVFAPPTQAFLGTPLSTPWRALGAGGGQRPRRVYSDERLKIFEIFEPDGLGYFGEIDAGNRQALLRSLELVQARKGDVTLDLSGVLFCDLGGLRAFVAAAAKLPEGCRVVLRGVPRELERAMSIVGWADLPNVTLTSRQLIEA